MTTPEAALKTARAWCAKREPGWIVTGLLEDETDWFLVVDDQGVTPCGGESVWISKATGKIWTANVITHLDKVDAMTPVRL